MKKFAVIPLKYVNHPYWKQAIAELQEEISEKRVAEGKDPNPEYLVINTDEPYIQEIIDVLKKHNHWG